MKPAWHKLNLNLILLMLLVAGLSGLSVSGLLLIIKNNHELPLSNGEVLYLNRLTGQRTVRPVDFKPVAVMIDNATEIRPQSGLAVASLVYEALVEGGITRLMAVYNAADQVDKVGPVRSVRPYFLDWAAEYQPAFFHVGGSPQALETIDDYSIIDLNEMGAAEVYFVRGDRADWPHNVYTNSGLWQNIPAFKNRHLDFKPWEFTGALSVYCPEEDQAIVIDFSYFNYQVKWLYDCQSGRYQRFNGGVGHLDENGDQLSAAKVVVQFVKSWLIDAERLGLQTVGQGKAIIFQNGQVVSGSWQKDAAGSRTEFLDDAGQIVQFIPGNTWIEVIPPLTNVSY